jgi:hypothetical protein
LLSWLAVVKDDLEKDDLEKDDLEKDDLEKDDLEKDDLQGGGVDDLFRLLAGPVLRGTRFASLRLVSKEAPP